MLQTIVLSVAALLGIAILALLLFASHQSDLNLRRRIRDAETGGHPLSNDETAAIKVRGIQLAAEESSSGRYAKYRQRNALTRTHVLLGALLVCYMVVFALVVDILGFPLGFITMYVFGQAAAGIFVLRRRRSQGE